MCGGCKVRLQQWEVGVGVQSETPALNPIYNIYSTSLPRSSGWVGKRLCRLAPGLRQVQPSQLRHQGSCARSVLTQLSVPERV